MAWPTRTLTAEGFKEYKDPVTNLREGAIKKAGWEGLDDWRGMGSDKGITLWNIKGNPVWESAAKANNIDWNVLTNSFPDQVAYNVRKNKAVEWWFQQSENYRPATTRRTGGTFRKGGSGPTVEHVPEFTAPSEQAWGLDSREGPVSTTFINDMNTMNDWIKNTVKKIDNIYPDSEIIQKGPTREQYGLPRGQDPWEFYGLDKLPRILPKALDVDYEYNLMDAKPSSATYRTPKGYPGIDLDAVETAELGESFTDYVSDYDFAQEYGYWDYDMGNDGGPEYQEELKFIFGDAAADVRIFGQEDYNALTEQGLSKDDILQTILRRVESGQKLIFGPAMAKLYDRYSYDPRWWGQPADTLGQKGVRLLKLQGLDEAGIMNRYAKGMHGSKIGQWVKDHFGVRIWPETGMYDYFFMDPGDKKAFGMQDYYQFEGQGMDHERIKLIATELVSAGWTLGPEAAKKLGLRNYQAQWQSAHQSGHLGGQVIDAFLTQGRSLDWIRAYGENPEVNTIGSEAAKELYGWTDKGEIGNFGMKDITENWPDGNVPNGVVLAKIAAGNAHAIGPAAVDYIWGHDLYDLHMSAPPDADPASLTFGMGAINYLRANHPAASNPAVLKAIANGAPFVGAEAAKELGIAARIPPKVTPPTVQEVLTTPIAEYDKPTLDTGEYGGFGQQEINWMSSAGWSKQQMRDVTKDFDAIGPAAGKHLWGEQLVNMMPAPPNAVDPNALTFGMETIKYLDSVDPQIQNDSIAAIARGMADYVGEGALDWFAERGIDVGKGSAPLTAPRPRPAPSPVILPEVSAPLAPAPTPAPTPAPAPAPKPEPPQQQPYVEQGNRNHFESSDLNYMRDRGYTRAEIRKVAESQSQIGTAAAQWIYDWSPRGGDFGQQDYNALKSKGASESTIRNIAKNQSNIGAAMARHFWGYTDPGDPGFFGQDDYNQLKGRGASEDVMRAIIRGMGLRTGNKFKRLG